jgi:glycosyltransferase involved in cell wall biosynthesis
MFILCRSWNEMQSVLVIGGYARSLILFREALLRALVERGCWVTACAAEDDEEVSGYLRSLQVAYHSVRLKRAGTNPLRDLTYLGDLIRLMRRVKPDVVLSYTIKPVIYGGLAAQLCGVCSIYSLVTGLGYAFMDVASARQRLAEGLAKAFYRLSLNHSRRVFFQNPDDGRAFVEMGLVAQDRVVVVNGSGVDLEHFSFVEPRMDPAPEGIGSAVPEANEPVSLQPNQQRPSPAAQLRFLLIARLLRDKGIGEYATAARILKSRNPRAEFHLIGPFDPNPTGLKPEDVRAWEDQGLIRFHGQQTDVRPFLRKCDVYVLPSYREGTPRTVLEAMATGRAIITTDAPGCRETVLLTAKGRGQQARGEAMMEGENGFLVRVRDTEALAQAMEVFIKQPELILVMGKRSREIAEEKYDVHKVNKVMMDAMGL